MPSYRSSYYRYGRRAPSRYWSHGYLLRRSSQAGRRRFSVDVPVSDAFQMTVAGTKYWSNLMAVSPYFKAAGNNYTRCNLMDSVLYRTYAQLYDQVKIDGCVVKISLMTNIGTGGLVPAVKLVSCWDRTVTVDEIKSGAGVPTSDTLQTGSEAQVNLIVNNSRAIVYRSNFASDIQERTTFHDCTVKAVTEGISDWEWYYGHVGGYCPGLFFALQTATSPLSGSSYVFDVAVEVRWKVTFRNPKFGLSEASKIGGVDDVKGLVPSEVVEEEKKDEMEEEEKPVLKKKKVVIEEEKEDDDDEDELNPLLDESQEPFTVPKPVTVKKAGKKG